MTKLVLTGQINAQNALADVQERAREERGEIGSQLILMAILVGAAALAAGPLRDAISTLVSNIAGKISGQDAG